MCSRQKSEWVSLQLVVGVFTRITEYHNCGSIFNTYYLTVGTNAVQQPSRVSGILLPTGMVARISVEEEKTINSSTYTILSKKSNTIDKEGASLKRLALDFIRKDQWGLSEVMAL